MATWKGIRRVKKGTKITAKQRAARKKNMAIARAAKTGNKKANKKAAKGLVSKMAKVQKSQAASWRMKHP